MEHKKKTLILQGDIPHYRQRFYRHILKSGQFDLCSFDLALSLYKPSYQKLIGDFYWLCPPLRALKNYDCLIVNGKYHNLGLLFLFVAALITKIKIVYWGHYQTTTRRGLLKKVKLTFLKAFHARIFYVEEEVELAKAAKLEPCYFLDNACHEAPQKIRRGSRELRLLFIGRVTAKVNTSLLSELLKKIPSASLGVIGHDGKGSPFGKQRVTYYGDIRDEATLSKIASQYDYGIYCGSIGLSILSYAYLQLPILLEKRPDHMPEIHYFYRYDIGLFFSSPSEVLVTVTKLTDSDYKAMTQNCFHCAKEITLTRMAAKFISSTEDILNV